MSLIQVYPRVFEKTNHVLRGNDFSAPLENIDKKTEKPNNQIINITNIKTKSSKRGNSNSITVTTSTTQLAYNNPERVSLLIQNTSSTSIYIGFDRGISTTNGILITQNSSYEINQNNLFTGEIYAIVASGSATVIVFEF